MRKAYTRADKNVFQTKVGVGWWRIVRWLVNGRSGLLPHSGFPWPISQARVRPEM